MQSCCPVEVFLKLRLPVSQIIGDPTVRNTGDPDNFVGCSHATSIFDWTDEEAGLGRKRHKKPTANTVSNNLCSFIIVLGQFDSFRFIVQTPHAWV